MKSKKRFFVFSLFIFSAFIFLGTRVTLADNTNSIELDLASSQYLIATSSSSLDVTGNLTLEAWVKFSSLPSSGKLATIVAKWGETTGSGNPANDSYALWLFNDGGILKVHFGISADAGDVNWTPSTGVWYHIAAVYSTSGNINIYINGAFQGTASGLPTSITDTNAPVLVGQFGEMVANPSGSQGFIDGKIDDVRIYNVARSQQDIQSDYSRELVGNETGLVAYWPLNNGYSDQTSNGNTLTAVNSPSFSSDVPIFAAPPTISSFTASPADISVGQSSTLSWSISGATLVSIDQGIGSVATSTSSTVVSPTATTTYTITASDKGLATSTRSVTVNVGTPPTVVRKSANQSITNNTTLQNDSQLSLSVQPGSYIVEGLIIASSTSATPDLKITFTAPSASDMNIGYSEALLNSGGMIVSSGTASERIALPADIPVPVMFRGTLIVSNAGTLQLKWAQFSSNANSVEVAKGSYLRITKY